MTIIRVGATQKYSEGWETAFGGAKRKSAAPAKAASGAKSAAKKTAKSSAKKKPAKKKAKR